MECQMDKVYRFRWWFGEAKKSGKNDVRERKTLESFGQYHVQSETQVIFPAFSCSNFRYGDTN